MDDKKKTFIILISLAFLNIISGFHFPDSKAVTYCKDEERNCKSDIEVFVNRLISEESIMSYDYEHFDFCAPYDSRNDPYENLGQEVSGDRIRRSQYKINFLEEQSCARLCTKHYVGGNGDDEDKLEILRDGIKLNYYHYWIVDDIPVTRCYNIEDGKKYCSIGIPVGCYVNKNDSQYCAIANANNDVEAYYLFNHVDIKITYQSGSSEDWGSTFFGPVGRITSVRVIPRSILHRDGSNPDCSSKEPMYIPKEELRDLQSLNITYTYSVTFEENNETPWSSRWDYILVPQHDTNIQWYNIFISLVIVLLLTNIDAILMLKILRKEDHFEYNKLNSEKDSQEEEEKGWKAISNDVFRPPQKGLLLSVFLGSGTQVLFMALITLGSAAAGFLSPQHRGAVTTCTLFSYVFMGFPAGYVSARIYESFGGKKWKSMVLLTALLTPNIAFCLFLPMNLVFWEAGSSAAEPFSTLVTLLGLWWIVSVPLTFIGAFIGFKTKTIKYPIEPNMIPRTIPAQKLYRQPFLSMIVGGILPFGCIFIQLFFILNSVWFGQMYYMYLFLFLVFLILIITCAETTILLCYSHLCAEDYNWWWRSFLTSGSTAFYLFAYCIYYLFTKLYIQDAETIFLYIGYTLIVTFLFFLLTGTIGFFACFWFIRKIYTKRCRNLEIFVVDLQKPEKSIQI